MRALSAATTEGDPLPGHTYAFVFPIIRAVLSSPQHTPLHDEAMAVVALHCAPGGPLPRRESLQLLYHVLGVNASYRCDPQTPRHAVQNMYLCNAGTAASFEGCIARNLTIN